MNLRKIGKGLVVTSMLFGVGISNFDFITINALEKTPEIIAKAASLPSWLLPIPASVLFLFAHSP